MPHADPLEDETQANQPHLIVDADKLADLAERYSEAISTQLTARRETEDKWLEHLALYEGTPDAAKKNWPWEDASNLVVNISGTSVDTVVARIMAALTGPEPHWTSRSLSRIAAEHAKPVERWLEWSRKNTWDQYRTIKRFALDTTKLGTGIIHNAWLDEQYFRLDPNTGERVEAGHTIGPAPRWVPLEDFLIPEGFTTIASAPWVAYRTWLGQDEITRLVRSGFFTGIDPETDLAEPDPETEMRRARRSASDSISNDSAVGSGDVPAGLFEVWQVWLREDLDGDGYPEEWVLTMRATDEPLPLRMRPNPYSYRMRPFVSAQFVEREGSFYGIGIPEQLKHFQAEITTIHNQRRDASTIQNANIFVTSRTSGAPKNLRLKPGDVLSLRSVDDIRELPMGKSAQLTLPEEQFSIMLAEKRIGVGDLEQGRASSPVGRAAATTVVSLMQEGSRRFDLNTAEIRSALSEQGVQLIELWQAHGLPKRNEPGSPENVLEGEDAARVRELFELSVGVRGLIGVTINPSTAALNREMEKQTSLQLVGIMSQYLMQVLNLSKMLATPGVPPELQQAVKTGIGGIDSIMKRVFQAHQTFELEQSLVGDLIAQLQPQAPPPAQGAEGGGPPALGAPPAVGLPGDGQNA